MARITKKSTQARMNERDIAFVHGERRYTIIQLPLTMYDKGTHFRTLKDLNDYLDILDINDKAQSDFLDDKNEEEANWDEYGLIIDDNNLRLQAFFEELDS